MAYPYNGGWATGEDPDQRKFDTGLSPMEAGAGQSRGITSASMGPAWPQGGFAPPASARAAIGGDPETFLRQGFGQATDPTGQYGANAATIRRFNEAMGLLNTMGYAERSRIGRQSRRLSSALRQRLINSGLGNSTILGPMLRRVQESADLSYQDLAERLAGRKVGLLSSVNDVSLPIDQLTREAFTRGMSEGYQEG